MAGPSSPSKTYPEPGTGNKGPQDFVPPSWDSIVEAHARIASKIHRTPVLTSSSLDKLSGARLFFKCDNFQKTGSFKFAAPATRCFP